MQDVRVGLEDAGEGDEEEEQAYRPPDPAEERELNAFYEWVDEEMRKHSCHPATPPHERDLYFNTCLIDSVRSMSSAHPIHLYLQYYEVFPIYAVPIANYEQECLVVHRDADCKEAAAALAVGLLERLYKFADLELARNGFHPPPPPSPLETGDAELSAPESPPPDLPLPPRSASSAGAKKNE